MPHILSKFRVCCRLRPNGERETSESVCSVVQNDKILLRDPRHKGVNKVYTFDRVYCEKESNEDIFQEEFGKESLARLFEGQNLTVFAHGATGSGKTFTMQGEGEKKNGVVPQAIATLFDLMAEQNDEYVLKFSLYEIYCEKVRDLLQETDDNNPYRRYRIDDLPIQKDICGFEVVADIKQETLTSPEHFEKLYERMQLRRTEKTNVNETSSRSHCCAQIYVEKVGSETKAPLKRGTSMTFHEKPAVSQIGRLFLVDLAGCEDNRLTGNRGQRMTESQFINDTYLALVKVFGALKRRAPLSAFCRDAKLTRLLRGALEDKDSLSLVFITISPSLSKFQATLNTFSYLHFQGEPEVPRGRPQSALHSSKKKEDSARLHEKENNSSCYRRAFSAGDDNSPQKRTKCDDDVRLRREPAFFRRAQPQFGRTRSPPISGGQAIGSFSGGKKCATLSNPTSARFLRGDSPARHIPRTTAEKNHSSGGMEGAVEKASSPTSTLHTNGDEGVNKAILLSGLRDAYGQNLVTEDSGTANAEDAPADLSPLSLSLMSEDGRDPYRSQFVRACPANFAEPDRNDAPKPLNEPPDAAGADIGAPSCEEMSRDAGDTDAPPLSDSPKSPPEVGHKARLRNSPRTCIREKPAERSTPLLLAERKPVRNNTSTTSTSSAGVQSKTTTPRPNTTLLQAPRGSLSEGRLTPGTRGIVDKARLGARSPVTSKYKIMEMREEDIGVTPVIKESRLKPRRCSESRIFNHSRGSSGGNQDGARRLTGDALRNDGPHSELRGGGGKAERKAPPQSRENGGSADRFNFTPTRDRGAASDIKFQVVSGTWNALMRLGFPPTYSRMASIQSHGDMELALKWLAERHELPSAHAIQGRELDPNPVLPACTTPETNATCQNSAPEGCDEARTCCPDAQQSE